jgi:hypothetical protein
MENAENKRLSEEQVIAIFREAVRTLKKMPPVRVQGYFNAWPEIIYTEREIMRMDQKNKVWRATPDAISRMEKAVSWLSLLEDAVERKIVWMRANNIPWDIIKKTFGFSRVTANKKYKNAIKFITQNYPDLPIYGH